MGSSEQFLKYYGIDLMGYEVFLQLYSDPQITISKIADNLDCSTTLVTSRLDQLRELGIIRPISQIEVPLLEGPRLQTDVEAIYDPSALNLQRVNLLYQNIPDRASLHTLEKFIEIHPYSHYCIRSFYSGINLFVQFDIPNGKVDYIQQLTNKLVTDGYFEKFQIISNGVQVDSRADFNHWKLSSQQWTLNDTGKMFQSDGNDLDYTWREFLEAGQIEKVKFEEPEFAHRFDHYDMKLLRELTVNARVSPTDITDYYDIDRSNVSRRINRLRKLVAPQNRFFYNQKLFDLTYQQLLVAEFDKDKEMDMHSFYSFIQQNNIPFSNNAVIDDNKFMWYLNTSPHHAVIFSDFIWRNCKNLQIHQLDLSSSFRYYFFNVNYVDKLQWNESKEYIVDQPLVLLDILARSEI